MAKQGCRKCGTQSVPLYATQAVTVAASDLSAVIQLREGFYLDTTQGLRRLLPGGIEQMDFNTISTILRDQGPVLYFRQNTDRLTFQQVFPEFQGWDI